MEAILVDPCVDLDEAQQLYAHTVENSIPVGQCFTAVIAAVAHKQFVDISPSSWQKLLVEKGVLLDLKGIVPRALTPLRL